VEAVLGEDTLHDDAAFASYRSRVVSMLHETDRQEREYLRSLMRSHTDRPGINELLVAYEGFPRIDAELFALQYANHIFEKDIIETIRISPRDAQTAFSRRDAARKVCGDEAAHFSGFFKKSWRSNDILWGRLDAACQLVETFFDRTCVADRPNPVLRERLHGGDLDPAKLFPRSPLERRAELREWLMQLASDAQGERDAAWARLATMRPKLIEAAQLEILQEDLPSVIHDAIAEQSKWNQFQDGDAFVAAGINGSSSTFQTGAGVRDSLVDAAAAAKKAADYVEALGDAKQGSARLRAFFCDNYRVGEETLTKHVPPFVLLEVLAKSMLVTRNALLSVLDGKAQKINAHWAFRLLSAFLWAFYGLAVFMRRSDSARRVIVVAAIAFVVVSTIFLLQTVGGMVCDMPGLEGLRRYACDKEGTLNWGVLAWSFITLMLALLLVQWFFAWLGARLKRLARLRKGSGAPGTDAALPTPPLVQRANAESALASGRGFQSSE
jgi:hypothetical protein